MFKNKFIKARKDLYNEIDLPGENIGMFQNMWIGIIGLAMLIGFGLLFIKALAYRIKSNKDNRYSRNVEK